MKLLTFFVGLIAILFPACNENPSQPQNEMSISISKSHNIGIPPFAVTFTPNFHGMVSDSINNIVWDFGDGSISKKQSPTHIFHKEGKYNVNLEVRYQNNKIIKVTDANTLIVDSLYWDVYRSSNYYQNMIFDSAGIPVVRYGSQGLQYNPVTSIQYALGSYNLFLITRDTLYLEQFQRIVNWLPEHYNFNGSLIWFPYYFEWRHETNNMGLPWVSGMAQGEALSLYMRAYLLSEDEKFLNYAKKIFNTFLIKESEGTKYWIVYKELSGETWIEEYPSRYLTCHVLNGMIFSLAGLYEYWYVTQSPQALELFLSVSATIEQNMPDYDRGDWSYYCYHNITGPQYYNTIHAYQLKWLSKVMNSNIFEFYSDKFFGYSSIEKWDPANP